MRYHILAVLALLTSAPISAAAGTAGIAGSAVCFPSTGHQFGAALGGTGVEVEFHTSLLSTVRQPGGLGIETSGRLSGRTVVGFRVGVVYAGFENRSTVSKHPLDAVSIPVEIHILPSMFSQVITSGDASADDVDGPVTRSACHW